MVSNQCYAGWECGLTANSHSNATLANAPAKHVSSRNTSGTWDALRMALLRAHCERQSSLVSSLLHSSEQRPGMQDEPNPARNQSARQPSAPGSAVTSISYTSAARGVLPV